MYISAKQTSNQNTIIKTCNKCKKGKSLTEFYPNARYKHGVHPTCKECFKKYYEDKKERQQQPAKIDISIQKEKNSLPVDLRIFDRFIEVYGLEKEIDKKFKWVGEYDDLCIFMFSKIPPSKHIYFIELLEKFFNWSAVVHDISYQFKNDFLVHILGGTYTTPAGNKRPIYKPKKKWCGRCRTILPTNAFKASFNSADGFKKYCMGCDNPKNLSLEME